jgi:hypothetical protein
MPPRRSDLRNAIILAIGLFVGFLAFPYGRLHAGACRVAATLTGRGDAMPCGLSELSITLDTDRHPWFSVKLRPISFSRPF